MFGVFLIFAKKMVEVSVYFEIYIIAMNVALSILVKMAFVHLNSLFEQFTRSIATQARYFTNTVYETSKSSSNIRYRLICA